MKFSFDETEIINCYFEEDNSLTRGSLVEKINTTIKITEDSELSDICKSSLIKIKTLSDEKFNAAISNLPFDTISVY